jgi:hypothetical protein
MCRVMGSSLFVEAGFPSSNSLIVGETGAHWDIFLFSLHTEQTKKARCTRLSGNIDSTLVNQM